MSKRRGEVCIIEGCKRLGRVFNGPSTYCEHHRDLVPGKYRYRREMFVRQYMETYTPTTSRAEMAEAMGIPVNGFKQRASNLRLSGVELPRLLPGRSPLQLNSNEVLRLNAIIDEYR